MCSPSDATPHILEEPNNEQWFLAQGFRIEVEAEEPGRFWTHLVHQNNEASIVTTPKALLSSMLNS